MDRRGLGWIGTIVFIVIGSLILTFVFNPQFREDVSEMFERQNILPPEENVKHPQRNILSPEEVVKHLHKYIGKEITVEGYYFCFPRAIVPFLPESEQEETEVLMKGLDVELSQGLQVYLREHVRMTGILEVREKLGVKIPTLIVSEIEPI